VGRVAAGMFMLIAGITVFSLCVAQLIAGVAV
jgi:hypothetical protein